MSKVTYVNFREKTITSQNEAFEARLARIKAKLDSINDVLNNLRPNERDGHEKD